MRQISMFDNLLKRYNLRVIERKNCYYFYHKNILLIKIPAKKNMHEEIIALLIGVKPAVYQIIQFEEEFYINKRINILGLDFVINDSDYRRYIIYYKEKTEFSKLDILHMLQNIPCNHDKIGKLLGFPPSAIEDFCNLDSINMENWTGYQRFGFSLGCCVDKIKEVRQWFETQYNSPLIITCYELEI